jgi:hypothetical protein
MLAIVRYIVVFYIAVVALYKYQIQKLLFMFFFLLSGLGLSHFRKGSSYG